MSLSIDIQVFTWPSRTNFSCQLFRLMAKADFANYARLAIAFPNAATVREAWLNNEPIPDLPYDAHAD